MGRRGGVIGIWLSVLLVTAGCTGEVVDGRAVGGAGASGSGSSGAPSSGAAFRDPDMAAAVLRDARVAIVATNSYSYRSLPAARANALKYVTGAYLTQYLVAFDGLISKTAPSQRFVQRASVNAIGLGPVDGAGATVLAFGQLAISSSRGPARVDAFELEAHLREQGSSWLIDRIELRGSVDGVAPVTPALTAAVAAARSGVRNVLTFSRASFAADYARALASTTGTLRRDVLAQRANTSKTLVTGDVDLVGDVRAAAVVTASGEAVVTVIAVDGYRVKNGARGAATTQTLRATTIRQGGRWLLSELTTVTTR